MLASLRKRSAVGQLNRVGEPLTVLSSQADEYGEGTVQVALTTTGSVEQGAAMVLLPSAVAAAAGAALVADAQAARELECERQHRLYGLRDDDDEGDAEGKPCRQ